MDLDGSIYRITTIFFSITDRKRGRKEKKEKQKGVEEEGIHMKEPFLDRNT